MEIGTWQLVYFSTFLPYSFVLQYLNGFSGVSWFLLKCSKGVLGIFMFWLRGVSVIVDGRHRCLAKVLQVCHSWRLLVKECK